MAQQAIINYQSMTAEDVYRHYYVLHGYCLRLATLCTSLGFSNDKKMNADKIEQMEEISEYILLLSDEVFYEVLIKYFLSLKKYYQFFNIPFYKLIKIISSITISR
jgi:hypothetical protein